MNDYIIAKHIENDADIKIYLLNIVENINHINRSIIPQAQINDISRYRIKMDRDKRLLARSFLYEFLNKHYSITNFELDFNEFKKPFINEAPNIRFNFSYAKDYALVGISKEKKIGIDIEYIDPTLNSSEIAPQIMCKAEWDQFLLYADNSLAQRIYFFKLFSAKEAVIKAFGTGLYFDVKSLSIIDNNKFTYGNVRFTYHELGLWMDQYSIAICFEE